MNWAVFSHRTKQSERKLYAFRLNDKKTESLFHFFVFEKKAEWRVKTFIHWKIARNLLDKKKVYINHHAVFFLRPEQTS